MKDNAASFRQSPWAIGLLVVFVGLAGYGAWTFSRRAPVSDHRHDPGTHGGMIVAVGDEHHHVEALFADGGVFKLFTLGKDQTQVVSVPEQKITAYVRTPQSSEASAVVLQSKPQPGDPTGETSSFEGQLPLEFVGARLLVIVPNIAIGKGRYRFQFLTKDDHEAAMPQKVTDKAESDLYLTPGGKYTAADIKANGSTTASARFRGFQSAHDLHPVKGETICPITHSKANPKCTWVIGGKKYSFCCPPCVDEFVKLAKEHPEQVQEPGEYVQN